jgi:thiamine pyrophosphate-dependent acetolactate synthase large subunit-like protein
MSGSATRYGSDAIVDLMIEAGVEQVAFNPGASFRGIHDSLVHADAAPQLVLCLHEAVSVAVAQGYAKASGKPMAVLLHDVVGLQNASMAIYNAWCDRAPMLLIGGTGPKSKARRRPWIDWIHTATVQAEQVRNYVKWDDEPHDMQSVPESFARAYTATCAEPSAPVYLCYDVDLQEDPLPEDYEAEPVSSFPVPSTPTAPAEDLDFMADALRAAERPAIIAGYTGGGVEVLADALGAPVIDKGMRLALPTSHPLNASGVDGVLEEADVILALDVDELRGPLGVEQSATLLNVSLGHLRLRGWAHDYQPLQPAARNVTADADSVVAGLLQRLAAQPLEVAARRSQVAGQIAETRAAWHSAAASAEADGRIPLDRLIYELGRALAGERFVLANGTNQRLEHRLWDMSEPGQYLGWHAGGGLGYGVGATIGASIALGPDTISVSVQADGDLLYLPSALWTAARLGLPVLIVVHNNRQYGNTVEHAAAIARARGRDAERRYEGAGLTDPSVGIAGLGESFGVWATGPVTDASTLPDRLAAAVEVARSGRPALVDVVTPGF